MARKIAALLTPEERKAGVVLLGLMVIGAVLETLGIGLVIPVIAVLIRSDVATAYPTLQAIIHWLGSPSRTQIVIGGMTVLIGVFFLKTLYLTFLAWLQARFAFGVMASLSQRLFATYLRQPYVFHLQRNTAHLIRNAVNEVRQFTVMDMLPGMMLVTESLMLLAITGLLLAIEPVGAILVGLLLGVALWGFYHVVRVRVARWGVTRQHHDGLRLQHLQEGLGGAKDVLLLGRETEFLARYRTHSTLSARAERYESTMQQLPRVWLEFLAVGGLTVLVISMVLRGREGSSILPTLGLFAAAAFRLIPSVNRVLSSAQSLRYGQSAIDTIYAELRLPQIPASANQSESLVLRDEIRLRNVTFTYPGALSPALRDLSIVVEKGESVGLIGASGSGKSTLVDVLLGLLTPQAGQVLVDGKDVQDHLRAWQDQIGYVPQSIYLTDDTLRRNVAFGLPDNKIDDAAVARALEAAQLSDFFANQPQGLETLMGERGVRLSGGQRQRIGIARALYHDPALLVLDEATSALDTETEREVMEAVVALHGQKTILIVAHRLSTLEHCDRLYRLEQCRVVGESASAEGVSIRERIKELT